MRRIKIMKKYGFIGSIAVVFIGIASLAFAQNTTSYGSVGGGSAVPVPAQTTSVTATASAGSAVNATMPASLPPQILPVARKCGVNTFQVMEQCGNDGNLFNGAYWQCYDGYEEKQYSDACKSSEEWQAYGKKICESRCEIAKPYPQPMPPTPAVVKEVPTVVGSGTASVLACYANEKLMRQYEDYMAQLRKANEAGDEKLSEDITNKIISLKQEIAKNQGDCGSTGFTASRANVQRAQSITAQSATSVSVNAAVPIGATTKPIPVPVVVNSGHEIGDYYSQKFQSITIGTQDVKKQIDALKNLRTEIDGLIQKLIQGKSEFRASEIGSLVPEIKILPGEIRASEVSVKSTDKKVMVGVGGRELSVEPKENKVIINDDGLNVKTDGVSIKDNVVSIGNSEVKVSPSAAVEKLQVVAKTMELKEENSKAVYKITADESRKLFGIIPVRIEKSFSTDAASGDIISESRPWWSFLSTKQ